MGRWLSSLGFAALVLRYRLAPSTRHPAMLEDAREAVRVARADPGPSGCPARPVGILGFSAGGHLASLVATDVEPASGGVPDFAVLVYPVIRMTGPLAHPGCRAALTGVADETEMARSLDADERVSGSTPPTFVVHGVNDEVIGIGNALAFAQACRRHGVECELHAFADGPHGFGLARRAGPVSAWPGLCEAWMRRRTVLASSA